MQIIQKNMLWIMLLLTLAACFYVAKQEDGADQDEEVIVLARHESTLVHSAQSSSDLKQQSSISTQLLRAQVMDEPKNIFTVFISDAELRQSIVQKTVEAPPANPFVFAGKLVDEGKIIVFLMDAQNNHSVVTGDILDEVWLIKSITPPMMTIRYLPLKIDMQLQIGALS